MITIGTLKLDLVADREPFVHDLYGRWDTFNRTSLEVTNGKRLSLLTQEMT